MNEYVELLILFVIFLVFLIPMFVVGKRNISNLSTFPNHENLSKKLDPYMLKYQFVTFNDVLYQQMQLGVMESKQITYGVEKVVSFNSPTGSVLAVYQNYYFGDLSYGRVLIKSVNEELEVVNGLFKTTVFYNGQLIASQYTGPFSFFRPFGVRVYDSPIKVLHQSGSWGKVLIINPKMSQKSSYSGSGIAGQDLVNQNWKISDEVINMETNEKIATMHASDSSILTEFSGNESNVNFAIWAFQMNRVLKTVAVEKRFV
jgi:hypothetical protein